MARARRSFDNLDVVVSAPLAQERHLQHSTDIGAVAVVGSTHHNVGAESILKLFLAGDTDAAARSLATGVLMAYDAAEDRLIVATDGDGFGRAYVWEQDEHFAVSTELPLVVDDLRHAGEQPRVDAAAVGLYLGYQYVPSMQSRSLVEGITNLGPGRVLERRRGRTTYWQLPGRSHHPVEPDLSPGRLLDILSAELETRVDQSSEHVGLLLSGGIDTTTNCLLMTRQGHRPPTFTAHFTVPGYDESSYARLVADHFGLSNEVVTVGENTLDLLDDLVACLESPNADQAALAELALARKMGEREINAVVTGEGGDEVLGMPQSPNDDLPFDNMPRDPLALARSYFEVNCVATSQDREKLFGPLGVDPDLPAHVLADAYRTRSRDTAFDTLLEGQWRTWLVDGVWHKDNRVFRGEEIRPTLPLASTAVQVAIQALSPGKRREALTHKKLLRAAIAPHVPTAVLTRGKHKFWMPMGGWFRDTRATWLRDRLMDQAPVVDLFGRELLAKYVEDHLSGTVDNSRILWSLLVLNAWLRRHGVAV